MLKRVTINLVFDYPNEKVLMIRKLRGMRGFGSTVDGHGKDKYNFPGGKKEKHESFYDCGAREIFEETNLVVRKSDLVLAGQLWFVWPDGTVLRSPVFKTDKFSGAIGQKTDECIPEWVDISKIPYENMWANDKVWLSKALAGEKFNWEIIFAPDDTFTIRELPLDFRAGLESLRKRAG